MPEPLTRAGQVLHWELDEETRAMLEALEISGRLNERPRTPKIIKVSELPKRFSSEVRENIPATSVDAAVGGRHSELRNNPLTPTSTSEHSFDQKAKFDGSSPAIDTATTVTEGSREDDSTNEASNVEHAQSRKIDIATRQTETNAPETERPMSNTGDIQSLTGTISKLEKELEVNKASIEILRKQVHDCMEEAREARAIGAAANQKARNSWAIVQKTEAGLDAILSQSAGIDDDLESQNQIA